MFSVWHIEMIKQPKFNLSCKVFLAYVWTFLVNLIFIRSSGTYILSKQIYLDFYALFWKKIRGYSIAAIQLNWVFHLDFRLGWETALPVLPGTGKSISEALNFASTNPQYDKRLFIELPLQYMKIPSSEHGENTRRTWPGENMLCTQMVFCFDIQNNLCKQIVLLMFYSCSSHVLSLEFSCTEVVSQWTIFCHIVG
jgi:hypothetical protein